jgi:hypothetical protein
MLVRCNINCRENGGMTDASLDVKTGRAVCNDCGDELINISSYTKNSMKMVGDVIRGKNRKAFIFSCEECGESKEVDIIGDKIVGAECDYENFNCKFSITDNMVDAIKMTRQNNMKDSDNE